MIKAFPKIFAVGQRYVQDIFEDEVEVTEKIDGSQFSVAKIDNELIFRSRGRIQQQDCPDKLFKEGIDYLLSVKDKIPNDTQFYMEYLKKSNHNVLSYGRIPKNHFVLFGVYFFKEDRFLSKSQMLSSYADMIDIESVPVLFKGKIENFEELKKMLQTTSFLGKSKIEGIVIKNYHKDLMLGGHIIPIMCAKYVSEEFKEVHDKNWKREKTVKGRWETFKEKYQTEARWLKSLFYLRDNGELEESPKDIGKLMKRVNLDITEECKEEICEFLWKEFSRELLRQSTKGLAEWYKEYLAKNNF